MPTSPTPVGIGAHAAHVRYRSSVEGAVRGWAQDAGDARCDAGGDRGGDRGGLTPFEEQPEGLASPEASPLRNSRRRSRRGSSVAALKTKRRSSCAARPRRATPPAEAPIRPRHPRRAPQGEVLSVPAPAPHEVGGRPAVLVAGSVLGTASRPRAAFWSAAGAAWRAVRPARRVHTCTVDCQAAGRRRLATAAVWHHGRGGVPALMLLLDAVFRSAAAWRRGPLGVWVGLRASEGVLCVHVSDGVAGCPRPVPPAGVADASAARRCLWGLQREVVRLIGGCVLREAAARLRLLTAAAARGFALPQAVRVEWGPGLLAAEELRGRRKVDRSEQVEWANLRFHHAPERKKRSIVYLQPVPGAPRRGHGSGGLQPPLPPRRSVSSNAVVAAAPHPTLSSCLTVPKNARTLSDSRGCKHSSQDSSVGGEEREASAGRRVCMVIPAGHVDKPHGGPKRGSMGRRGRPEDAAARATAKRGEYRAFLKRYREAKDYAAAVAARACDEPPYTFVEVGAHTPHFYLFLDVLRQRLYSRRPRRLRCLGRKTVVSIKALRCNPEYTGDPPPPTAPSAFVATYKLIVYRRGKLRKAVRKAYCILPEAPSV